MRFHFGLVSSFVFASTVLAHSASAEHSQPFARAKKVTYNSFQAGVSLTNVHNTFQAITASIVLPKLSGDVGSGVNMFIAIDGDACSNVSLRAGVMGKINQAGSQVYKGYLQWYPGGVETFEDFTASSGDTVVLIVTTTDSESGSVTIVNGNNRAFAELTSANSLCRVGAMWFVEPLYDAVHGFYPLANFTTISFGNAEATGNDQPIPPTDSHEIHNILENNKAVTAIGLQDTSVTVNYL